MTLWSCPQVQMARAEVKRVPWPKPDDSGWMADGWQMVNRLSLDAMSPMAILPHDRPSTSKVQDHQDRVLSEGRREVGIWSSYGVKEWHGSGIEEAARELEVSRNHILLVGSRDKCLYVHVCQRFIL